MSELTIIRAVHCPRARNLIVPITKCQQYEIASVGGVPKYIPCIYYDGHYVSELTCNY